MSDVLARICDDKRAHVARQKAARPLTEVEADAERQPRPAASPVGSRPRPPPPAMA